MESTIILSGFNVNGYENLAERANQNQKKQREKNQTWSSTDEDAIAIPNHDPPSSFFPLPSPNFLVVDAEDVSPTMGKTLQLYWNPGRTNVRPNSSINLQVNQGPPFPPYTFNFLLPGWPSFYTPSSLVASRNRNVRARVCVAATWRIHVRARSGIRNILKCKPLRGKAALPPT